MSSSSVDYGFSVPVLGSCLWEDWHKTVLGLFLPDIRCSESGLGTVYFVGMEILFSNRLNSDSEFPYFSDTFSLLTLSSGQR